MTNLPYESDYHSSHLLTVAIDKYDPDHPDSELNLSTAKNGARAFYDLLKKKGTNYKLHKLEDKDATRDAILDLLQNFQIMDYEDRKGEPGSVAKAYINPAVADTALIIYVAGHGIARPTRDGGVAGYFIPSDWNKRGDRNLNWNALLPLEAFTEARHFFPHKHVLFIFDCCFAGTVFTRSMLSLQADLDLHNVARHLRPKHEGKKDGKDLFEQLTARCAYQVLAAGNYNQPVLDWFDPTQSQRRRPLPDDTDAHSPFTKALLEALDGPAADDFGLISADALALYIRKYFENNDVWSHADHLPRHGYLPGHDGGDFVLLKDQQNPAALGWLEKRLLAPEVTRRKAVIALISPSSVSTGELAGRDKTQWAGIEYHRCLEDNDTTFPLQSCANGKLEKLWLVCSAESRPIALEMQKRYQAVNVVVKLCEMIHPYSSEELCETLKQLFEDILSDGTLKRTDLIIDVTGGTTPMSIGVGEACQVKGIAMQYCRPDHMAFAGGKPNPTIRAMKPVLLNGDNLKRWSDQTDE